MAEVELLTLAKEAILCRETEEKQILLLDVQ